MPTLAYTVAREPKRVHLKLSQHALTVHAHSELGQAAVEEVMRLLRQAAVNRVCAAAAKTAEPGLDASQVRAPQPNSATVG